MEQVVNQTQIRSATEIKKKRQSGTSRQNNRDYTLLAIPAMLKVFIFAYLPMFGIVIAFQDYNFNDGFLGSKWVGLDNFKFFFQSVDALRVTKNTVVMSFLFIVTGSFVSILFALMLFEIASKRLTKFLQSTFFFPYFISWVVVSFALDAMLLGNGIVNSLFTGIGLEPIRFYMDPKPWPLILVIVHIWKGTGYGCLMYYSALMGIDPSYYEAADIDGASRFQKIRYISLPFLKPIFIILTILAIGNIFRSDFGMFYFLPKNSTATMLYQTTDVIDTYVYRALRQNGNLGMSSAVGLYQSFVGFVLIILTNQIVKKIDKNLSLF